MRKLILILALLLSIERIQAQTMTDVGITDTSKYLRDSIESKKSYYLGNPLSKLLKDLKVKVKSYVGPNTSRMPDTVRVSEITFTFFSVGVTANKIKLRTKIPNITIRFVHPILIPKQYFKQGNLLENFDWDSRKEAFFANCIIASIEVRGLSPNKPPLLQNLLDTTDHH